MLPGKTIITTNTSLKEIKKIVRDRTVDRFVEELQSGYKKILENNDYGTGCKACLEEFIEEIENVASHMKAGNNGIN